MEYLEIKKSMNNEYFNIKFRKIITFNFRNHQNEICRSILKDRFFPKRSEISLKNY